MLDAGGEGVTGEQKRSIKTVNVLAAYLIQKTHISVEKIKQKHKFTVDGEQNYSARTSVHLCI